MTLSIFDLDETLIATDSGSAWLEHLVDTGQVDADFLRQDAEYMAQYNAGELSMTEYMAFSLQPIQGKTAAEIDQLMAGFVTRHIAPHIYPQGQQLIRELQAAGQRVLVISATVDFVVRPIARALGVEDILAINIGWDAQGRATGDTEGVLSFREGKVTRLQQWLAQTGESATNARFYSDSINDLPLLEYIDQPIATNPHPRLLPIAQQQDWPILDWRALTDA